MTWLILASVLWAFSFGLIKTRLSGFDPLAVAWLRLALSLLVFSPFLFRQRIGARDRWHLAVVGAVQFGMMYMFYISAYRWLPAHAVALLTVLTPLYVVVFDDTLQRRFSPYHLGGAMLAIIGAGWIAFVTLPMTQSWPGIALLQIANLCFAVGQVLYRRVRRRTSLAAAGDATLAAWMFLGAMVISAPGIWRLGGIDGGLFSGQALLSWLYLGIVPSGIAFWMWNKGAARTTGGWLAISNNLKIPLGIVVAALVFGENVTWLKLITGSTLIGIGFVASSRDNL